MFLPQEIITILNHFEPAFTRPTYQKAMVLVVGTILARGRRTVTAALRQMGLQVLQLGTVGNSLKDIGGRSGRKNEKNGGNSRDFTRFRAIQG